MAEFIGENANHEHEASLGKRDECRMGLEGFFLMPKAAHSRSGRTQYDSDDRSEDAESDGSKRYSVAQQDELPESLDPKHLGVSVLHISLHICVVRLQRLLDAFDSPHLCPIEESSRLDAYVLIRCIVAPSFGFAYEHREVPRRWAAGGDLALEFEA